MATNAFIGRATKPTEAELASELGPRKPLWDELLVELERLGVTDQEWSSYSLKSGWALKVLRKKRVIVYLGPMRGGFRASFVLGEKAIAAAKASKLSAKVHKLVSEGKRYPEGTAVRIEIASHADVSAAAKLAAIKLAS
ncbi:MAG TPA: DUF3788 family protein [Terriglobales bacterium]|nr:DUF3788 family protein [Terriglobales bacterium]